MEIIISKVVHDLTLNLGFIPIFICENKQISEVNALNKDCINVMPTTQLLRT